MLRNQSNGTAKRRIVNYTNQHAIGNGSNQHAIGNGSKEFVGSGAGEQAGVIGEGNFKR
jgi:hypothetical protein